MGKFSPVPGTADIFPEESARYRKIEETGADVFGRYGYGELRTPTFEYTEVFQRGLGDDTEVVQKEMYTFEDRGSRSLTLRPEGTAGVMRALLTTDVMNGVEQRVFYYGSMFRGERPAAGRRREFHQIGVENVGRIAPELDAECIAMLYHFLQEIGITDVEIRINSRGVAEDRVESGKALKEYFAAHIDDMCEDCKVRLEKNIWRILDCKQQNCRDIIKDAPDYRLYFSEDSRNYFKTVCETLDALKVPYIVDPMLVRGLDYYVHTVFELSHNCLGSSIAIAGGGRYELYLPGQNRPVKGVGFAAGIERLLMVQDALNIKNETNKKDLVYLVSLGDDARKANIELAGILRRNGLNVALEVENRSMKAQMRSANNAGASFVVIRGDNELAEKCAVIKNMTDGTEDKVAIEKIYDSLV